MPRRVGANPRYIYQEPKLAIRQNRAPVARAGQPGRGVSGQLVLCLDGRRRGVPVTRRTTFPASASENLARRSVPGLVVTRCPPAPVSCRQPVLPACLPRISHPAGDAGALVNRKAGHQRSAALRKGLLAALSLSRAGRTLTSAGTSTATICIGPRGSGSAHRDRWSRADGATPAV